MNELDLINIKIDVLQEEIRAEHLKIKAEIEHIKEILAIIRREDYKQFETKGEVN